MSRPCFLADQDFHEHIIRGVLRREPLIEFVKLRDVGLASVAEVLAYAAAENRRAAGEAEEWLNQVLFLPLGSQLTRSSFPRMDVPKLRFGNDSHTGRLVTLLIFVPS